MKKLAFGALAVTSLVIIGCAKDPAEDKFPCIRNMVDIQAAVGEWCEKHDYNKMPTMKQLVDAGELKQELKCPTDGSAYTWSYDGVIRVSCPHADKGHKMQ